MNRVIKLTIIVSNHLWKLGGKFNKVSIKLRAVDNQFCPERLLSGDFASFNNKLGLSAKLLGTDSHLAGEVPHSIPIVRIRHHL